VTPGPGRDLRKNAGCHPWPGARGERPRPPGCDGLDWLGLVRESNIVGGSGVPWFACVNTRKTALPAGRFAGKKAGAAATLHQPEAQARAEGALACASGWSGGFLHPQPGSTKGPGYPFRTGTVRPYRSGRFQPTAGERKRTSSLQSDRPA
jgi:hypothetical protein